MANRTLRRANAGNSGTPVVVGDATRIEPKPIVFASEHPESATIVDRDADESDTDTINESGSTSERVNVVDVDPANLGDFIRDRSATGSGDSDGNRTRRRRSDAGSSRTGTRSRRTKEAPANVEALVTMVHTWASVLLKTPEIMLAENEVKQLSDAYSTFCEHHEVPVLTPKRMSEVNLIATALMIYGSRFVAIKNRRKEQRAGNVQQMPTRATVGH